jgi:hypothetical protein
MRGIALLLSCLGAPLLACSSATPPPPAQVPVDDAGGTAPSGSGGDTWTTYASGFVTTYCVGCHDASDPKGRDYKVEANVQKEKSEIRCGVATTQDPSWSCATFPPAKQFPVGTGAKPSDADRARFVAWISAGAP